MRVSTQAYIPSIASLDELVATEEIMAMASELEVVNPGDVVATEIFKLLKPGREKTVAYLRADGLTYNEIAEIMGLSNPQVRATICIIKARITLVVPALLTAKQYEKVDKKEV